MRDVVLWVLLAAAVVGLIVVQWRAMAVAKRLGSRSNRGLVALRAANLVALLALMAWVVWTQVGR